MNALSRFEPWDGSTYYGRAQLKAAPFQNSVVGGYIFLAGLSGSAAILASLAENVGQGGTTATVRRGRALSLLAPTIGSALLIYDLHTPKRFYNMLRVAKSLSPMSIGTWILMSFSGFAMTAAVAEAAAYRWPEAAPWRAAARWSGVGAAFAGAGLSTYTAALLAATSTPLWAAAPKSLAVRFGSSAMASAAAALALRARDVDARRKLSAIAAVALATELAATAVSHRTYKKRNVAAALAGPSGAVERWGATGVGVLLPLGLFALAALGKRRSGLTDAACLAVLAGGNLLRVSVLSAGDRSAHDPDISFVFSQPSELPGQE